jgi:hypothetical protein
MDPISCFPPDGCLYLLKDWRKVARNERFERETKLADFNGLSFQFVRAPSDAMRWK